jgi:hypothetical protein
MSIADRATGLVLGLFLPALSLCVDVKTALESYRSSKSAFAQTGIPIDEEIKEHLAVDAQVLKLPEAVPPSQIFDFSLQREVNRELGLK